MHVITEIELTVTIWTNEEAAPVGQQCVDELTNGPANGDTSPLKGLVRCTRALRLVLVVFCFDPGWTEYTDSMP